ncbi:uncharacterized protein TNCV_422181 [Trichonephila clavipes]|nr:uncharacterized protein TNCV_422181 [Trichonephila clavipes]
MGSRTRGRPPTRWIDDVENDLKTLNIKSGRELLRIVGIGESELWRQPRPVTGCYAYKEEENLLSKIQSLKYRIQQQYSQNKSQKVFTPSTALRHNCQCPKYTYVKDNSKAIARSTAEVITTHFNGQGNTD